MKRIVENPELSIEDPARFVVRETVDENTEPVYLSDTVATYKGWRLDIMDSVIECPECGNMLEQDAPTCGDCGTENPWWGLVF